MLYQTDEYFSYFGERNTIYADEESLCYIVFEANLYKLMSYDEDEFKGQNLLPLDANTLSYEFLRRNSHKIFPVHIPGHPTISKVLWKDYAKIKDIEDENIKFIFFNIFEKIEETANSKMDSIYFKNFTPSKIEERIHDLEQQVKTLKEKLAASKESC